LQRTARLLPRRRSIRKGLPALLFFTDPVRTPDPEAVAARLPRGSAIVYRHFGAPDAEDRARRLKAIARARGLKLLIGQDIALAARIGADGVHLPERLAHCALAIRRAHPAWIVTSAAHSLTAARASRAGAVVVSVAFPSKSASAGGALGPIRLAALARAIGRPAYALGGVNEKTARRLKDAGLVGLAAVDGLRT
jgi:thiamine-phosphate pyrophosphorylase